MKQITLPLTTIDPRPVVHLEKDLGIYAMLDTGAVVPVWVDEEKHLQAIGGVKTRENAIFGGFGGNTSGPLYHIPTFTVGDLTFPHLPVIVSEMNAPFHMILSATMFKRLIYEIDDFHHKLNITVPDGESFVRNIKDYDDNGRLKIVLANEISTCL